ncbi:sphingosine N-acyltransferase lac1, partial [Aureobasidium melanogenum]
MASVASTPATAHAQSFPQHLNMPTCNPTSQTKKRSKRKHESLSSSLCATLVEHQLGLSINVLMLLVLTHVCFPSLRSSTIQYFTLSYYDAQTGLYNPGWQDLKFVSLCIIVFTGLRAAAMDYALVPMARKCGIHKKKATIRFAEQAWLVLYYAAFWFLGTYLVYESPYFNNLPAMWSAFPTRSMTGLFKLYYLAQFGFWLQQIMVINIEERRKDHWQMFTHHIITCLLLIGSYGYYQTKVGNVILCLMDVVDLVFPIAKLLKYMGMQTACDIAFGVFMLSWFVARHVFYLAVCWSIYADVPVEMPYGCYNAVTGAKTSEDGGNEVLSNVLHAYTSGNGDVCFNEKIHYGFLGLLLALQVITIIWFGMICRVAYRVVCGKGADDTRSDDEEEEEEEEEDTLDTVRDFSAKEPELRLAPLEEEVGVESLRFTRRPSPAAKRTSEKSRASGISIPGNHKELLGRIGCDKPAGGS